MKHPVPTVLEPPNAQSIYQILDGVMSAVLTQPDADIPKLLSTANKKINGLATTGS